MDTVKRKKASLLIISSRGGEINFDQLTYSAGAGIPGKQCGQAGPVLQ